MNMETKIFIQNCRQQSNIYTNYSFDFFFAVNQIDIINVDFFFNTLNVRLLIVYNQKTLLHTLSNCVYFIYFEFTR